MLDATDQKMPFANIKALSLHDQKLVSVQELLCSGRHRVQLLTLQSGGRLPEKMHLYASKTLVVMEGCATIICKGKEIVLLEGLSYAIAACTRHRIMNSGKIPLRILDIRSGACVEDDDRAT